MTGAILIASGLVPTIVKMVNMGRIMALEEDSLAREFPIAGSDRFGPRRVPIRQKLAVRPAKNNGTVVGKKFLTSPAWGRNAPMVVDRQRRKMDRATLSPREDKQLHR